MPPWGKVFGELKKRNILTMEDYEQLIHEYGTWATHLATARVNPDTTTRDKVFTRAEYLYKRGKLFFEEEA
jgi:hypothetical protein